MNFSVSLLVPLVLLMIDFSIEQEIFSRESDKGNAITMYVVCDPQNLCDLSPCRNGGTCYSISELPKFVCVCAYGFGGKTCADGK